MAILVLLRNERGGYALYKDGDMVANFSRHDYRWYIDEQIEKWKDSPDDDVIERKHVGPWKEQLENKGVKNERLKSLGNKKPSQVKEAAKPAPEETASPETADDTPAEKPAEKAAKSAPKEPRKLSPREQALREMRGE